MIKHVIYCDCSDTDLKQYIKSNEQFYLTIKNNFYSMPVTLILRGNGYKNNYNLLQENLHDEAKSYVMVTNDNTILDNVYCYNFNNILHLSVVKDEQIIPFKQLITDERELKIGHKLSDIYNIYELE